MESTVKASNFGPHGSFGHFLATSVASLDEVYVPRMNRIEFANV
jgi:hypothetical protein